MKEDHIWTLIARKLKVEATAPDLEELTELLKDDQLMEVVMGMIREFWEHEIKPAENETEPAFLKLWRKIKHDRLLEDKRFYSAN